ncbi:MAG: T9SS type A sorting domain-containing protein [Ignavibacterium sp.]|nr:T9SS type A sorting domain-containing protein [Ignavibacterium sp.]
MIRIFATLIILTELIFPQSDQNNFRIFPSTVTQTEPVIAVSKTTPSLFFASGVTINTSNGFKSEGVYVSTDYGSTWFGSDTCYGQLIVNHGGDPGIAITPNNRLILTHIGSVFPGVYSHYSDDFGLNWSNAYTVTNQQTDDKGTTLIDDNVASPFYGRIYSALVKLISPYPIFISYSDNNAESWTLPTALNPTPSARCVGPSLVINNDGKIFICWADVTSQPPFFEDYIGFASSTDGGLNWNITNNIFDANGIIGTLPEKGNIRVNGLPRIAMDKSGGERNSWLYIVTTDKNLSPAGSDPDIILHRSTDSGQSWSSGIRVNQDPINNGKIQYFPAIDVDNTGTIHIIYYDDRNTTSDSAEVFISKSTDGGDSWFDTVLSDHRFKPKPVFGGSSNYQGDYISLISNENKLYAYWMDDYSGIYQIWCKIKDIPTSIDNEVNQPVISDFYLSNNYPNPFNPGTTIEFNLPNSSNVSLKLFDITGQEVATILSDYIGKGNHSILFDAAKYNLSSGVYFYTLSVDGYKQTKSMMLLK